jgi:hypothetical protein
MSPLQDDSGILANMVGHVNNNIDSNTNNLLKNKPLIINSVYKLCIIFDRNSVLSSSKS